jgi:hypothetical protein
MKLALVVLFSCGLTHAATVVAVEGPTNFTGSIGNNQAQTAGFTTGQAYSDVRISALLSGLSTEAFDAYLTTDIGPGTTVADQVAFTTVNFAGSSTVTTVFSGLSLPAGIYYLTLFNPRNTNGGWASTESPVVTAEPGSSHVFSGYFITNDNPLPFPPAASFVDLTENSGRTHIYSVETVVIPEPASVILTLAGLCVVAIRVRMRMMS